MPTDWPVPPIRAAGHGMPILMLTARTALDDRLEGFEAGADDYLPKPFAFAELAARVERAGALRRATGAPPIAWGWRSIAPRNGGLARRAAGSSRAAWRCWPNWRWHAGWWNALFWSTGRGADAVITDNAVDVAVSALRKRLSPAPSTQRCAGAVSARAANCPHTLGQPEPLLRFFLPPPVTASFRTERRAGS
jgi:hypothetical protein